MKQEKNKKPDVSVIVPVLNEEKNIIPTINNILQACTDSDIISEIIVVDDGSKDKTADLVNSLLKKNTYIKMFRHKDTQGIGKCFWDGVDNSIAAIVVMIPGDNENDTWEIFRYHKLLEHVDIVIPFIFNREVRSFFRNILSFVYRFIINTTFLTNFNYTNGTVMYRKSILKKLDYRNNSFFFQTDILVKVVKQGYLFAEVPYRLGLRKEGISNAITYPSLLQVIKGYLCLVKEYYFRRSDTEKHFSKDSLTANRRNNKVITS